mmetsp:Transcript_28469/g.43022  ORF Transcript_28469/g.43022 Transcript_28469/m.43022 type:complete len:185 (+) Transcript_28469:140-694(+)|eukprot:CAMPEP_0194752640 /NCGR_PEP_ID=MMETSP0323_2-20130528/6460_1 /TAXON_ID=2866 ORGANISM="Crypthecodinium cohnii, Strain Seligo" /NCGR_SAMPLE_ID=MMETSP0323_2 /ASSEMBLY_ACC=CAM_ASM_000346 /LENGTH=184 /DNA_ID=CAMNT_0039669731 /DNA_START=61 /DNA_END=615 /DNA_ORIENTATION=+
MAPEARLPLVSSNTFDDDFEVIMSPRTSWPSDEEHDCTAKLSRSPGARKTKTPKRKSSGEEAECLFEWTLVGCDGCEVEPKTARTDEVAAAARGPNKPTSPSKSSWAQKLKLRPAESSSTTPLPGGTTAPPLHRTQKQPTQEKAAPAEADAGAGAGTGTTSILQDFAWRDNRLIFRSKPRRKRR